MIKQQKLKSYTATLILGLSLFTFNSIFIGCSDDDSALIDEETIEEENEIATKTLSVADFTGINLAIAADITIKQGTVQEVKAIGDDEVIDNLKTSIVDDEWKIDFINDYNKNYELSIEITVPNISNLTLSSSGTIKVNDFSDQSNLILAISGSGNMEINKFEGITNLGITLSGSGNLTAQKDIKSLNDIDLKITGSGSYYGYELSCKHAIVKSTGSGNTELLVVETLNAKISGAGSISYKGTPSISSNITGTGDLFNAN